MFPAHQFKPRVTITSAIPYVNGIKHLGNIIGSLLPADIFHRYLDLMGVENIFICGTDEHGTPTELAAAQEGIPAEAYAKKYHDIQKSIYERWHFDFTHFGRSSSPSNHELTKKIFLSIYNNGYITKQSITIPFCTKDNRVLPDRYLNGTCPNCSYDKARGDQCEQCGKLLDPVELKNPYCSICGGKNIIFKEQEHLFLDFPLLQDKLKQWIEKSTWPDNTKHFALGWIHEGLKPRCITRNIDWGIPVPLKGFEHLVFYVWFDAPIAYISMTKDAEKEGKIKNWRAWWTESKIYHFLGKDNVPFHTIFWPATLMAAASDKNRDVSFSLPTQIQGYEYLNWNGKKFSTSQGVGLFSDEALDLFPVDYWRYYLASVLPETKDSNFDWDDFQHRINNELVANYGNLFYRVTHFVQSQFDSKVPAPGAEGQEEEDLKQAIAQTLERVEQHIEHVTLREALKDVFGLASVVNKYFQDRHPWNDPDREHVATTLYYSINALRVITILLAPFIPSTSKRALQALHADEGQWEWLREFTIEPGHTIAAEMLFEKIEAQELEKAKAYQTKYKPGVKKGQNVVSFEEFSRLDLRTGTILEVQDHPNADRLYVLTIDMGTQKLTVVNGLKPYCTKEQLKGKQVIVVVNLQPKDFRGVKSTGMILACEDMTVLVPEKQVKNGEKIV
ncbi:MAG: methionine--tRNA ligase [Candidatus Aenigmarchaeota archaeon]|nr:methionine--tRNA ligase [Candidatus Aenigmarchaeota archaeon]